MIGCHPPSPRLGAWSDTRYSFRAQYSEKSATMCPLPTSFERVAMILSEVKAIVAAFYNKKVVSSSIDVKVEEL